MPMAETIDLRTEYVDYADGDTVCEGYVAHDASLAAPRPCVLVAHDWSGQGDAIRMVARRVARLGWVAFALDVYGKGIRGDLTGDNSHLMTPLLADRALLRRRLLAGLAAAQRHPAVDARRVAAIGYCFGGLCALDLARAVPEGLLGVVSFHGVFQPPALGAQPQITAKVLLLHGWEDPLAPPGEVLAIARELTDAKADWQLHAYGHAMHAFTFEGAYFPERGIAYDAAAARRSWAAMRGFLDEVFAS
ncbi:MAG: dienelactone hydrolase family protein [Thermodesulfobacteriota bacterium]